MCNKSGLTAGNRTTQQTIEIIIQKALMLTQEQRKDVLNYCSSFLETQHNQELAEHVQNPSD